MNINEAVGEFPRERSLIWYMFCTRSHLHSLRQGKAEQARSRWI